MDDIWLPGFERVWNDRSGGGTYEEGQPKKVWHSVEGFSRYPRAVAAGHPTPPHLWVTLPSHPYAPRVKLQIVPLNRSAFALKRPDGMPSPNKAGMVIQTEVEGFARDMDQLSLEDLEWLGEEVLAPVCEYVPINPMDWWETMSEDQGVVLASTKSPLRRPYEAFKNFNGQLAHQAVYGNTHWDAPYNLGAIGRAASRRLGTTGELDMAVDTQAILDRLDLLVMAITGSEFVPGTLQNTDVFGINDLREHVDKQIADVKLNNLTLAVNVIKAIQTGGVKLDDLSEQEIADLVVQELQKIM